MLRSVILKPVSRTDVSRVATWLRDDEVSSRWFGHYACGDPVHRGYEPLQMLTASESEWDQVFRLDPRRFVYSVYSDPGEHVGECQASVDDRAGAELSVLIGRKDLWHLGYGTSTVIALLDQVFGFFRLESAWVNVPDDNGPALGLFKKMGFQHVDTRQLCTRPDESVLHGHILAMKAADFQARRGAWDRVTVNPVVTIAGMPGSGSEALGRDVAALIGACFMDEELTERVAGRLKRTVGELESLEAGVTSVWARLLTALMAPWERYGAIDATFAWPYDPYPAPDQHLTKEQYGKGVKSVVCELATQGNVVLHGGASDLFVPPSVDVIRVFVEESYDRRLRRFGTELGIGTKEAEIRLARADGHVRAVSSHLFGRDLLDMDRYDLVVNMARMPHETAAGVVAAAFEPAAAVVPVPGGALVG